MLKPKKLPPEEEEGVAEDFPTDEELLSEEDVPEPAGEEEEPEPMEGDDEAQPFTQQQATPEEQEAYDMFVAQAYNLIYDEKVLPQIVGMLEGEGDPVEGLARAAAMVISRVKGSAEEAGVELSGDVLLHAGTEVLEDLAELSKESGVKDYTQDPDSLEAAYFRALDIFRVELQEAGKLDPEANQRDLEILAALDEQGELENIFSNLANEDTKAAQPADDRMAEEEPV